MNWKDFFYFSKRERRGILSLSIFIAGIFVGKWIFTPEAISKEQVLVNQMAETPKLTSAITKTETQTPYPRLVSDTKEEKTKPQNKKPEEKRTYYKQEENNTPKQTYNPYPKTEKFEPGTVVELNFADTTELKKIPGIGSSYAKRIVGYRNLLGGYHRMEQLQEVYGMYEELYEKITPFFSINTDSLRLIEINNFSLDRLKSHPYINFYQAKAIIEVRKKKKKIESFDELILLEEFTEDDRIRIIPYLSFE